MSETLRIATANTYYGQTLRDPNGLKPFAEAKVDALLLQEVLNLDEAEVRSYLASWDFQLAHSDLKAGLAIAVNKAGVLDVGSSATSTSIIQDVGHLGKFAAARNVSGAARLRHRALITSTLRTQNNQEVALGTTHPIVFARPLSRKRQIKAIADALHQTPQLSRSFILGADMNHYPRPQPVDKAMGEQLGLSHVPISEPTWHIRGSKHQWLATLGSLATRRPVEDFDAQLDSMWYRGAGLLEAEVIDISSDHRAILGHFALG